MSEKPQRTQYKKKDENHSLQKEESKGQSHRGGRGGHRGGEDRPKTQGGKPHYQRRKEDGTQQEGGHHQSGDGKPRNHQHKEENKDSFVYKYYYGERPKIEKVAVTLETEVPAILPKDQRKQNPDKNVFDKNMRDLDQSVEQTRSKI